MDTLKSIYGMLSEPLPSARVREEQTFAEQLAKTNQSVVIFGAGRLGRVCAQALARAKIRLCAFCDNAPLIIGTELSGVPVLIPEVACQCFGEKSLFIVAIWPGNAVGGLVEKVNLLIGRGCLNVVSHAALLWAHGRDDLPFHSLDLPSRLLAHAPELEQIANRMADDLSVQAFHHELRRRFTGEFCASSPASHQYFPPGVLKLTPEEVVADVGAYSGDTLMDFAARTGSRFLAYHAFEPDLSNLEELERSISRLPDDARSKVQVHGVALSDRVGHMAFCGGRGNTSQGSSEGEVQVPTLRLDTLRPVPAFTFIKIDVEGGEYECLTGAVESLRDGQPTVAVCTYHRPEHLWTLPQLLITALPSNRFFYRMHGCDGWESVFYAVGPTHQL